MLLDDSGLPESLLGDLSAILQEEREEERLSAKRGDRGTEKKKSRVEDEEDDLFGEDFGEEEADDNETAGGKKGKPAVREAPNKKRKKDQRSALNELLGPDADEIAAVASARKPSKPKAKTKKKISGLTPAQETLMQQATNAYIDGKFKQAVALLLGLIKEAPKVPLLYQQLGAIYENTGDIRKALDLFIVAATLGPRDVDSWRGLARQAQDAGEFNQAAYCFDKLLRLEPEDVDSRFERAMLHQEMGESSKAIEGFKYVLAQFPDNTQVMKELAEVYHASDQTQKAIVLIEGYLDKFRKPKKTKKKAAVNAPIDLNIMNVLCELYQLEKRYADVITALDLLNTVPFEDPSLPPDEPQSSALPIDLVVRKGIAYLNLGNLPQAELLFNVLQEEKYDMTNYADLYLEVAEAFVANKHFDHALSLYDSLQNVHDVPGIWLRYAQCLRKVSSREEDLKRCMDLYEKVLEAEPHNMDARLELVGILKELGEDERALSVVNAKIAKKKRKSVTRHRKDIERDEEAQEGEKKKKRKRKKKKREELDPAEEKRRERKKRRKKVQESMNRLKQDLDAEEAVSSNEALQVLLAKAELLEAKQDDEAFLKECLPAIKASIAGAELLVGPEEEEETGEAASKSVIKARKKPKVVSATPHPSRRLLGTAAFLDLIRKAITALSKLERDQEASDLALQIEGWGSKKSLVQLVQSEAADVLEEMKAMIPAILYKVGDYEGAYRFVRFVIAQNPHSFRVVYLANQIISKLQFPTKCVRFLERTLVKFPDSAPLRILMGHCYLMVQNYTFALDQYGHVFRDPRYSQNPTVSLFMGIASLHKAMLRRTSDRHHSLMRASSFFHFYYRLSNESAEAAYNVARMYHFLGLTALATQYYNKVLMKPGGLQQEAAHNLATIYVQSGSPDLARRVYREYCTI